MVDLGDRDRGREGGLSAYGYADASAHGAHAGAVVDVPAVLVHFPLRGIVDGFEDVAAVAAEAEEMRFAPFAHAHCDMEGEVLEVDGLVPKVHAQRTEDPHRGVAVIDQIRGAAVLTDGAFGGEVDAYESCLCCPFLLAHVAVAQVHVQDAAQGIVVRDRENTGEQLGSAEHLCAEDVHPAAAERGQVTGGARITGVAGVHDLHAFQDPCIGIGRVAADDQMVGLVVGVHHSGQGCHQSSGIEEGGRPAQALLHGESSQAQGR